MRRDSLAHLWKATLAYLAVSKQPAHTDIARDEATFDLNADANTLVATSERILMRYRNDEKGMRQDFIVKKKPSGKGALRVWLEAKMTGGRVEVKADAVSFVAASGAEAMRYSELKVWDASGKRLAARFEGEGARVAIVVEDGRAVYPITIDPLSTTPNWTAESNQANARFGFSVSTAGDVNGDGFSDVIVGAHLFDNGQTDEGRAFVYYGNEGAGLRQDLRQFRPSTTTPIVPALKTTSPSSVTLQKRQKSIAGRNTTKLQVEVKPLGTPFNGLGLTESSFALHATTGTPTPLLISGLSNGTLYKWRVRQVERSTGVGYAMLPRSRWYYPAGIGPTESHFQVSDDNAPLPVELSAFTAEVRNGVVHLAWTTASEQNNAGFEVQRRSKNRGASHEEWQVLGFVRGNGTTTEAKSYSFLDGTATGTVLYRLKQVDFDGAFEYSPTVEVEAGRPKTFALSQNYPNPFNPTTVIGYQLPVASEVSLKVYDMLGREVATLVNGRQEAGSYRYTLNASGLSSGVYFYTLRAGNFTKTMKMMLVK